VRDGTCSAAERPVIDTVAPHWQVAELSIVPQGDGFLVGDAKTAVFVLLPPIGVEVIGWLREGHALDRVAQLAREHAGEDVDVADFVASLQALGFAREVASDVPPPVPAPAGRTDARGRDRVIDHLARLCFNPVAWTGYALAALASAAAFWWRPELFPHVDDLFFLSTPARSIATLTVLTYLLATLHEGAHWLAARAVGVRARITISRRLYFLAFETDLTGLWSLPRRRRFGAILAGMALDAVILAAILAVRLTEWPNPAIRGVLPALTFLQVSAIAAQFFVFARTDVYALLVTATGTVNLYRTTQLSLLAATRLAKTRHTEELVRAPGRDVRVARWYRWVWLAGMALAAWFFVAYFVPATVRTFAWVATTVWPIEPASVAFWEAVALGVTLLSPRVLTGAVALRDLGRRGRIRRRRRPPSPPGSGRGFPGPDGTEEVAPG
jgi:hypothetical protein